MLNLERILQRSGKNTEILFTMPRGSRHKPHRQHHKQTVKDSGDSDEGENTRYGPELLPEAKIEGKRGRDEGKVEFLRDRHEIQKRKSQPQPRELGPGSSSATYFSAKKKRGEPTEVVEADASADRWNGGEAQGDALSLLAYLHCSKDKDLKTDSESSDRNVGVGDDKDDARIEDKGKRLMKGKGSDTGSGSTKPSAIDTPDLLQANPNVKSGRTKGSRRRETQESLLDQGNSSRLAEESPLLEKAISDALNTMKLVSGRSGTKGRWDKGLPKKELKEPDEGALGRDVEWSSDREKKVRISKPEKATGSLAVPLKNFEGNRKQVLEKDGFPEETLLKQEQKHPEWQLQDDLRNIELEKELENRIQRRRDESGERDRWRDDDRDGEGKRFYRDDRQRDDRFKDQRQRDDEHKDDKYRDDRNKDDKHREEKDIEDRYKDDKLQDIKHRERRPSRDAVADKYDSKHSREGSRVSDSRYKESKHYDSDRDYSSHRDERYSQSRDQRDQGRLSRTHEDSRETKDCRNKFTAGEGDGRGLDTGHQDDNLDHEKPSLVLLSSQAGDSIDDKQNKRLRGIGSDTDREEYRFKLKHSESESKDKLAEEKPQRTRNDRLRRNIDQLHGHSREPGRLHCKNKAEKKLDGHRDESPLGSARSSAYDDRTSPVLSHVESSPKANGRFSPPVNAMRKSPSYIHDLGHSLMYDKTSHKNKSESGNNLSGAIGMHHQASRSWVCVDASNNDKQQSSADGIGGREPQGICKSSDDHRRSPSTERGHDSQMNSSFANEFSRASSTYASGSRVGGPSDSRRIPSSGTSVSSERPSKGRRLEEAPSGRSDWTAHSTPMTRAMGSPIRPQLPSLTSRPSGVLPPPPPFRPGIDNPAILGPSSTGFEEVTATRDQRRTDRQVGGHFKREAMGGTGQDVWKGVGNWNSLSQGQGPGNMFIPFQHHMGGHPHGGFLNMPQQFPGPPLFGIRPSPDMGGVRYHMRDGGDAFPGHNRTFGWQRQADDVCGPHMQVPLHAWDGPTSYGEESHVYGRPARDQIVQGVGARSWDRGTDMWKVNTRDTDESWGGPQLPRSRPEKIRRERSPTESIEIKRSDDCPPKIISENQSSTLPSNVPKPCKTKREKMSVYLSKLDISAGLAGPELYNDCVRTIDLKENAFSISDAAVMMDENTEAAIDNFHLEVDADAEALLNSLNMQSKFFPSLPRDTFERALTLYKNDHVKIKSYASPGANDPHKVFVASESSKESFCHTKLYDKTNADVDVTVVCYNTSTDVTSAIEFTNPLEYAVKNNTQTDQENSHMVLQDDAKMNNSISPSQNIPIFDVKEPMVNVKDADILGLGCNTNSKGCSEHPLDDVNTGMFSAECEDGVTDPELVDSHDPRGFSEEPNLNIAVSPEELTYGINSMHVSKVPVDPVDAIVLSEEQANIVGPLQVNNVPYLIKQNISILNTEEHKTMSNRRTANIDFRVTENSSRDFPVPIDSPTEIAVTNKAAAFLETSSSISMKLVRECEGESHSISMMPNSETVSQVSEFHERCDNVELDTVNVGCLDPNQQDVDLCGEAGIQQDESPGNTETALENAVESVDSKIGIRNFSPYNLPGSTR